jgi:hypothetical protein
VHNQSNAVRPARYKFSTVLLKSMWKRGIENAHLQINTELDAVCTKMKHFLFTDGCKTIRYRSLVQETRRNEKSNYSGSGRENKNQREYFFNTI